MPINLAPAAAVQPLGQHDESLAACILAAGVAKRLEPISAVVAKPAFPLGGRVPIVEMWVRKFSELGVRHMAMNLHRVPESLQGYFDDGSRFLTRIHYIHEEVPSGTLGGAIKMLKALNAQGIRPRRIFIPSGDIASGVSTAHLEEMLHQHVSHGAALTMMLAPVPWERRADFGTAVVEGVAVGDAVPPGAYARIRDFVEKDPASPSNLCNASNYLVESEFLLDLESRLTPARLDVDTPCYDFGRHVIAGMFGRVPHLGFLEQHAAHLYGYTPGTVWFDVGNKRDYLGVNRALMTGEIDVQLPYTRYQWGWMGEQVEIDFNRVTINAPVVIGTGCAVLPGAEVGPHLVLGDGWVVHNNATLSNAVLWPHYDFRPRFGAAGAGSKVREVRESVRIDSAIIVGGIIREDVQDQTVDVRPDGSLDIRSLDWHPQEDRA